MPRSTCDPCCNPSELARANATFKDATLQILCGILNGVQTQGSMVLGRISGANLNVTTDQPISMFASEYVLTSVIVTNASIPPGTAVGGIYESPSKVQAIIPAGTTYTLPAASSYQTKTLTAYAQGNVLTTPNLYLSLTTPQGAPATADFYVIGFKLS